MKVLVLSGGEIKQREIENSLEALQEIVDGYIEIPFLSRELAKHGIDIIINEEGKMIDGLKPEIAIMDKETEELLDVVYGNCIFASHNDEGDTIGLTEEQIAIVVNELHMGAMLGTADGKESHLVRVLSI